MPGRPADRLPGRPPARLPGRPAGRSGAESAQRAKSGGERAASKAAPAPGGLAGFMAEVNRAGNSAEGWLKAFRNHSPRPARSAPAPALMGFLKLAEGCAATVNRAQRAWDDLTETLQAGPAGRFEPMRVSGGEKAQPPARPPAEPWSWLREALKQGGEERQPTAAREPKAAGRHPGQAGTARATGQSSPGPSPEPSPSRSFIQQVVLKQEPAPRTITREYFNERQADSGKPTTMVNIDKIVVQTTPDRTSDPQGLGRLIADELEKALNRKLRHAALGLAG